MTGVDLVVFDAGGTLGRFVGPSTVAMLREFADVADGVIAEESRRVLHRTPPDELDDTVIADLCHHILMDPAEWPQEWPPGEFAAYPDAGMVLDDVAETFGVPLVVLSNIPCTTGPGRMESLLRQLPQISRVYTSYDYRERKPSPRLWQTIARDHDVPLDRIVHIGDQFTNDIKGAVRAGCRAIHVPSQRETPPRDQWPAGVDRMGAATYLLGVQTILARFADQP